MKANKRMRWTLALTLTGVCAALAGMALDARMGTGARADRVMLATAPPVLAGEERLLEQIETARTGLFAAQATVPARPAGRAVWLPVVLLAGGGGLIGCIFGLGVGSLIVRRRAATRTMGTTAAAAVPSRESRRMAVAPDDSAAAVLRASSTAPAIGRAVDPKDGIPTRREDADPLDRRIAALERSVLQVVRAMEEVAERVTDREASSARPRPGARAREQGAREGGLGLGQDAPRAASALAPAALPARPAPSLVRALQALRAVREQAPAVPEPWDLSPDARLPQDPSVANQHEVTPSTRSFPSGSTADGRDLVRIRRAVLRLAAEGWDGARIAGQLRLGEEDVALIVKTASAEPWSQPAGRER